MTVTFTLTTSSTAAGPFNISGTTSGGALNDVSIATGISKATLLTGHPISNISETITGGTIASTGTCTTTDTWLTNPEPTVYTYNCVNGSCIEVEGTGGTYGTLQLCQGSCSANPTTRYNCTSQGCVEAVDGDYATLTECNNSGCVQVPN
jgi:hypothetical protein